MLADVAPKTARERFVAVLVTDLQPNGYHLDHFESVVFGYTVDSRYEAKAERAM